MSVGCCWNPAKGRPCTASYPVHKAPPWGLSILFALQHLLVQSSLLFVCHFLLYQSLPMDGQIRRQLLANSLFSTGISTGLQITLGSRLPLVQAPSFELLLPTLLLRRNIAGLPREGNNDTELSLPCSEEHCNATDAWSQPIREVSGAIFIAGMLQLLLAISGLCGRIIQASGPMVLAPTISIIGLSSYREAAQASSAHWGTALLYVRMTVPGYSGCIAVAEPALVLPASLDMDEIQGLSAADVFPGIPNAFGMMLLPVCSIWIGYAILRQIVKAADLQSVDTLNASFVVRAYMPAGLNNTTTEQPAPEPIVQSSPWIKVPYPGELGWPLLNTRALSVGIVMAIASSMNSLGCYVLCTRVLRLPSLPRQACNRGVCMEAVGNLLCGMLGSVCGGASSIPNTCTIGLTQVGSRHSVLVSALMCVVLGLSPRATQLLSTIPMAVHGGVLCVTYGLAVGAGIAFFQYSNIESGRNIFIVGFTMFMALLVPRWFGSTPDYVSTGSSFPNLLLLSLLTSPVSIGGFFSFFLDNTVSGTLEERGLLPELSLWEPDSGKDTAQAREMECRRVYGLPRAFRTWLGHSRLRETLICQPFCLWDSEGGAVEEEMEASPEEGETLLEKPIGTEMEAVICLNQKDSERGRQSEC